ncbi:hypothetical protein C8R46DRAFT_93550 [Mycena filopes]|nr:hypothetical protein C8R46DRAFT_93550 [Mycena filopes]
MEEGDEIRPSTPPEAAGVLDPHEIFWRNLQPWLQQSGYSLRPRYGRDWIPSWKIPGSGAIYLVSEDSWGIMRAQIMDAVRDSDGLRVVLKRVSKSKHPWEEGIHGFLSSPASELWGDPMNHCAPLLDVLQPPHDPDWQILVINLLRKYDSPPFDTVGEAVDFFQQIFEGLQFMHKNLVAHRDCSSNNIMMHPTGVGHSRLNRRPAYVMVSHGSTVCVFDQSETPPNSYHAAPKIRPPHRG